MCVYKYNNNNIIVSGTLYPYESVSVAVAAFLIYYYIFWRMQTERRSRTRSRIVRTEENIRAATDDAMAWYSGGFFKEGGGGVTCPLQILEFSRR